MHNTLTSVYSSSGLGKCPLNVLLLGITWIRNDTLSDTYMHDEFSFRESSLLTSDCVQGTPSKMYEFAQNPIYVIAENAIVERWART